MATTAMHNLRTPRLPLTLSPFLILLSSTFLTHSQAQLTFGNAPTTILQPTPNPIGTGPPQTSATGYADTSYTPNSLGNYYFLLIGVFVIVLLAVYFVILRRRKVRRLQRRESSGEAVPASSGSRWPGQGRWRIVPLQPRIEEGLDERGEAPPPYMPGQAPPAAHIEGQPPASGQAIALQDYPSKPPDYDELTSSQEDLNLTRPSPTHAPSNRFGTTRHDGTRSPEIATETESSEMRSMENTTSDATVGGTETPATEMSMPQHNATSFESHTPHLEQRAASPAG